MKKAQTQVVTIVLISGIVISLVGTVYMWGIPLITKRTAITEFLGAEDFAVRLDQKITEIAASESGEATLDIPNGRLRTVSYDAIDTDNNSVIFEFTTDQPLTTSISNVVLKTSILGENATYGEAEARIITMASQPLATGSVISLRVRYRELDTVSRPYRAYKIAIVPGSISGTDQVKLSYAGTEVRAGQGMNGGDLILTKIKVDTV
jgi:hypothetical protein